MDARVVQPPSYGYIENTSSATFQCFRKTAPNGEGLMVVDKQTIYQYGQPAKMPESMVDSDWVVIVSPILKGEFRYGWG